MNITIEARSWDELKALAREIVGDTLTVAQKVGEISHTVTGPLHDAELRATAFNTENPHAMSAANAPLATTTPAADADEDDGHSAPFDGSLVDSAGLPWDERIHAGTKTKTAAGVWKKRKGVQEMQITEVENELRARMAQHQQPVMQAQPQPVMTQPNPAVDPAFAMFNQPLPQPVQQPMVQHDPRFVQTQPVQQPMQQFQQQGPVRNFDTLMATVSGLFNSQVITPEYMNSISQRLGVTTISDVANNPAGVAQAFALLEQDGKIQRQGM